MLDWSIVKYKFTLGIGALGTAAIMSELWKPILPAWFIVTVAVAPLAVFIIVRPREMPERVVRIAHILASIWYVVTVDALSVGLLFARKLPGGWMIFPLFCGIGLWPCVFVVTAALRGRYKLPKE